MAYSPVTDFLALLRTTPGGVRTERMPGLDWLAAAMSRAGMFTLVIGQVAPTANQTVTAWFKPALQSSVSEGALFLWNSAANEYELATIVLWRALLSAGGSGAAVVQEVTTAAANVQINATVVRVQNVGAAVLLTMPLAALMAGPVLISDWLNGATAHNITITLSGGDVFPGGGNNWTITDDAGSVFLRPVPGGYAL